MTSINCINSEDIDEFIEHFPCIQLYGNKNIIKWVNLILKKYLKRNILFYAPVENIIISDKTPDWVKKAVTNDIIIHKFVCTQKHRVVGTLQWFGLPISIIQESQINLFISKLQSTIDWWYSLPPDDIHLKHWKRVSVEEAIHLSEVWHERLARKAAEDFPEDWDHAKTITKLPDGFTAVKLTSQKALLRESNIMGHCVGTASTYLYQVQRGEMSIISIRDKNNIPHVTISIIHKGNNFSYNDLDIIIAKEGHISEMQGKGNTPPKNYVKQIKALISHLKISIGRWGETLGIFQIGHKLYENIDELAADAEYIWKLISRHGYITDIHEFHNLRRFLKFHKEDITTQHQEILIVPLHKQKSVFITSTQSVCKYIKFNEKTLNIPDLVYSLLIWKFFPNEASLKKIMFNLGFTLLNHIKTQQNSIIELRFGIKKQNPLLLVSATNFFDVAGMTEFYHKTMRDLAPNQKIILKNAASDIMRVLNSKRGNQLPQHERQRLLQTLRVKMPQLENKIAKESLIDHLHNFSSASRF